MKCRAVAVEIYANSPSFLKNQVSLGGRNCFFNVATFLILAGNFSTGFDVIFFCLKESTRISKIDGISFS